MKRRTTLKILFFAAVVGVAAFVGCGKKDGKHAPVCPYGQVLTYDDRGYNCRFISLNPFNYNQQGGVLNPPISSCPIANQVLVNWRTSWLCYWHETIYPSGGDSPTGIVPPPGRGGEYCTANGASNYGNNGYNNYFPGSAAGGNYNVGVNDYSVICSPGFFCDSNMNTNSNNQNYGQGGTCRFSGYH